MSLRGHCLCGAVTYQVEAEPMMTVNCHCTDCQRQSGAAFSTNVVAPREAFEISGDSVHEYVTTSTDTGTPVRRLFCRECGSPLASFPDSVPQYVILKAGTLDDHSQVSPSMEVWTGSAQDWVEHPDERQQFERGPG